MKAVTVGRIKHWNSARVLVPASAREPKPQQTDDIELKDLLDSVSRRDNMSLLEECRKMYDALRQFRDDRARCWRYSTGDQWGDSMVDPDDPFHRRVTEGEYIKMQGKMPLTNNVITPLIKSTLGIYRGNKKEPMAICRDRDEAKLGDMMSIALQYAYQNNNVEELNARELQEALNSAMFLTCTSYRWDDERKEYDVFVKNEEQDRVFFNADMTDIRMKDLHTIGFIRDYVIDELVQKFANSEYDANRIREEYKYVSHNIATYVQSLNRRKNNVDFYIPADDSKCRVIEVWRKETKERLRCHDYMTGEVFVTELSDRGSIDLVNEQRKADYVAQGMTEEDAPLIVAEWFVDRYWYVRYLSPLGEVLCEKRSPYWHNSHPYTIRCFPFINGETHSFVSEILPQQRLVNRYITMLDYINGASAKGLLWVPDGALPDGMTPEDLMREWSKPDSAIIYKWKVGMPEPKQLSSSGVQPSHVEMLNMQLQLIKDISGVHDAMQGQTASSGTPSSLYAQQAQNASNNLTDFISWFDSCIAERDYKLMKTIQQYYNEERYLAIAGHDYDEESKWYTPEKVKNSEFDITINEATATPAYRNVLNDFLMQMLNTGAIDVKMFLENVNMPFAARLLESVKKKEEEMQQQQQQMMAQEQQMAAGGGAAMPEQTEPEQGEGLATKQSAMAANRQLNDPKVLSLVNQQLEAKSKVRG